jgi:hypothetical protein
MLRRRRVVGAEGRKLGAQATFPLKRFEQKVCKHETPILCHISQNISDWRNSCSAHLCRTTECCDVTQKYSSILVRWRLSTHIPTSLQVIRYLDFFNPV